MGLIATLANTWLRDYVTDGVSGSGANPPAKADGRTLFGAVDALSFLNAGTSAPSSPGYGTPWLDTTNNLLKVYDGANWLSLFVIDPTGHTVSVAGVSPLILRSYLSGLTLSNDSGTPNSKIDVAAGQCADDGNAVMMNFTGGTLDCGTTGANGLDTGSLASSTWYHAFGIGKTDGTRALFASTSLTPTLPSGYTLKRRLGSFRTDSSAHILPFLQNGDSFRWKTPIKDVDGVTPGVTTRTTKALTVPTGVIVFPDLHIALTSGSSGVNLLLTSLDETDSTPAAGLTHQAVGTSSTGSSGITVTTLHTDTSAQIGYRVTTTDSSVRITTYGWTDHRGRDA